MSATALSYAIDDQDRLIRVDEGYYLFARENGWDGADASLGRALWDFVSGDETQKLQRMLLRRIRNEVRAVELPFRCDGPDVRREMDIRIAADRTGRVVLFSTRLRSEEAREVSQPMLDPNATRDCDLLVMCAWCDRFQVGDAWIEIEDAASQLELFRRSRLPQISHGICPDCSEMLRAA